MENSKLWVKISFVLNIIISILTAVGFFITFAGIKFSKGVEPVLESSKLGVFKYFTVDSNLFMGIIALLFAIEEYKLLKDDRKSISTGLYKLKLMATVGVSLTFTVVFTYLGPSSTGGISSMLMNSNLFFHLLIPVLSMINFMFVERCNKLIFKNSFLGLIPTALYSVFYCINILVHMKNGVVSTDYDFYWFVQNGWLSFIIVPPLMFFITYLISLILWRVNRTK